MSSAARIVLITAPDEDCARAIARSLVEERLLACANIVPRITSIYRWEGAVEEASEALLIGKTTDARLAQLETRLSELHPYDVPECGRSRPRAWRRATWPGSWIRPTRDGERRQR